MSDHEEPAGARGADTSVPRQDEHPGPELAELDAPDAPPAPPVRKTAEAWALERGHVDPPPGDFVDVPAHRAWVFKAAKALHGWPIGKELTGEEYDEAASRALHIPIR
jgi:hypothetical protein